MIVFPSCKINLGLSVLRKRPDGYHDLETVFYPLPLTDVLEIMENKEPGVGFSLSGLPLPGTTGSNLCVKAWELLKRDFPNLPSVSIYLHKLIPAGAGLGAGSADAAFTLVLLNKKFKLGLSVSALQDYALQLGSDCPFFILNKPCFAQGRGEKLEEIPLDLSPYTIVLVNPGFHSSTAAAFSGIQPTEPKQSVHDIVTQQPLRQWKNSLHNDFETTIFPQYQEAAAVKKALYEAGALYASMSGSGSTVYGIFEAPPLLSFPSAYWVKVLTGQRQ